MALLDHLAVELLAVAFAGGAFGAAVGALPSFSLAGLVVVLGELYALAAEAAGVDALPVDVTGSIAFGPVLGPHVAFGGGAAAVAYAAKRGYLDGDFEYHGAKEITRGLGTRPDVLAVGGAFGVLGYVVAALSRTLLPVDPVALGVVGSALAHRAVLGYAVVGAPAGAWLDVRPGTAGAESATADPDDRSTADPGEPATDSTDEPVTDSPDEPAADGGTLPESGTAPDAGRPSVEPWLPYQYRWRDVLGIGAVVGVLGAYVAYLTASPFLAFGLAVVPLALLCAGVDSIPVTHHVALPASTGALALVDAPSGALTPALVADAVPLWQALLVGTAFGVLGAALGELAERIFYAHAETHLDPPAASIVATSAAIAGLAAAGLLPSPVWIPTP